MTVPLTDAELKHIQSTFESVATSSESLTDRVRWLARDGLRVVAELSKARAAIAPEGKEGG